MFLKSNKCFCVIVLYFSFNFYFPFLLTPLSLSINVPLFPLYAKGYRLFHLYMCLSACVCLCLSLSHIQYIDIQRNIYTNAIQRTGSEWLGSYRKGVLRLRFEPGPEESITFFLTSDSQTFLISGPLYS